MQKNTQSSTDGKEESYQIKKKIIEAASQLYEQKGLNRTSVEEIAAVAGISVPVTYHHVRRQSDIMLLIMEDFTNRFRRETEPEIEAMTDPGQKLRKAMEVFYRLVDENRVKVILVYRESRTLDRDGRKKIMAEEMSHTSVFENIIQEGIDQGLFRPLPDVTMAAHNIIIAGHTWALKHWHYKKCCDLDEYLRRQTDFVMKALAP